MGRDAAGDALLAAWQALGASSRCVARLEGGGSTPVVSVILDGSGEVTAVTAHVELTPFQLRNRMRLMLCEHWGERHPLGLSVAT